MLYLKKIAIMLVFAIGYIMFFGYYVTTEFAKDHQGLAILLGLAFIPFLRMVFRNVN